jgi:hypothetical protein
MKFMGATLHTNRVDSWFGAGAGDRRGGCSS